MKAAVLYGLNQPVVVEDIEMEGPKAGEIVVKIAATGVCHSCHHAITGMLSVPFPVVLGMKVQVWLRRSVQALPW